MKNKISKMLMATSLCLFLSSPIVLASGDGHSDHKAHEHDNAQDEKNAGLIVKQAWTRATVKSANVGGGYLVVENNGQEADRLIAATVDFAERAEIHEMKLVDDVMQMRPLPDGIEIPAGGFVALKPGAEHVMFMGLKEPLKEGDVLDVILTFEKAGDVPVKFKVNKLAAKGHGEHQHNH